MKTFCILLVFHLFSHGLRKVDDESSIQLNLKSFKVDDNAKGVIFTEQWAQLHRDEFD